MTESKSKWKYAAGRGVFFAPVVAVWLVALCTHGVIASDRPAEIVADGGSTQAAASIRANLASVAASAFQPAGEGVVDLATFGAKPAVAVLNVPPPGSLSPAQPAEDHIPEPGAIGFGLAVAALIFGNFTKAVRRCWKMTSSNPNRQQ
jgi:hypothetical protein